MSRFLLLATLVYARTAPLNGSQVKRMLDQAAARQIQQPKTITMLSIFDLSTPLQIRLPALQRCRLNTSYTPFEAVRTMEQALLPTIEANRKGNLKNERTYLL